MAPSYHLIADMGKICSCLIKDSDFQWNKKEIPNEHHIWFWQTFIIQVHFQKYYVKNNTFNFRFLRYISFIVSDYQKFGVNPRNSGVLWGVGTKWWMILFEEAVYCKHIHLKLRVFLQQPFFNTLMFNIQFINNRYHTTNCQRFKSSLNMVEHKLMKSKV